MPVPFVDLKRSQQQVQAELQSAFERVSGETSYILGPDVEAFEAEFASYCGTAHCVGVSDGTEALRLGLLALGAGPEREVIAPAMTYIATAEAIDATGATPVLVDVGDDRLISPAAAEQALGPSTAAIIPVHLYGRPADMQRLGELADAAGVPLLEDACQAHGARLDGTRAGALGAAAAFSFYPSKNLGALGDGGALTTADEELAEVARSLRAHGSVPGESTKHVRRGGRTGRLDSLQAAFLRTKLPHLDEWNAQRRAAAELYREALQDLPVELPPEDAAGAEQVFHLFVVVLDDDADRDAVIAHLGADGVRVQIHYPTPVHLQPPFAHLGYARGDFPRAEQLADKGISLPLFPGITEAEVTEVATSLRAALSA